MKHSIKCVGIIILILYSIVFSQDTENKLLILGMKKNNIDGNINQIAIELFKTEFTISGIKIIDLPYEEIEKCNNVECALSKLEEYHANKALIGSLTRLGRKIIVAVQIVNYDSGGVYFADKININEIEDLDIAVKRLAAAVIQEKSSADVITKETITRNETEDPRRRKNFYTFGLRIGYLFPIAESYGKSDKLVSYNLIGAYEMRNYIVEARYTLNSGEYSFEQSIDFSLLYSLYLTDFSPYFATGLGVHWIHNENIEDIDFGSDGPAFNFGGGLFMFQTYDFRLWVDIRYSYLFLLDDEYQDQHGISISIGVTHRQQSGGGCLGIF